MQGRDAINRLALARVISETGSLAAFTTLGHHLFALTRRRSRPRRVLRSPT